MGNEKRFRKGDLTPGAGDYDITKFKSLGKASETHFGGDFLNKTIDHS